MLVNVICLVICICICRSVPTLYNLHSKVQCVRYVKDNLCVSYFIFSVYWFFFLKNGIAVIWILLLCLSDCQPKPLL